MWTLFQLPHLWKYILKIIFRSNIYLTHPEILKISAPYYLGELFQFQNCTNLRCNLYHMVLPLAFVALFYFSVNTGLLFKTQTRACLILGLRMNGQRALWSLLLGDMDKKKQRGKMLLISMLQKQFRCTFSARLGWKERERKKKNWGRKNKKHNRAHISIAFK